MYSGLYFKDNLLKPVMMMMVIKIVTHTDPFKLLKMMERIFTWLLYHDLQ